MYACMHAHTRPIHVCPAPPLLLQACQTYAFFLEGLPQVLWDALPPALHAGAAPPEGKLAIDFFGNKLRKGHATGADLLANGADYQSNLQRVVRARVRRAAHACIPCM